MPPAAVRPHDEPVGSPHSTRGWLRWPAGAVLAGHGLLHVIGVVLLLGLGEPGTLSYADARPEPGTVLAVAFAGLWALAGLLFLEAALQVVLRRRWTAVALAAALASVPAVLAMAEVAAVGVLVDVLVVAVILARFVARRFR